MERIAGPSGRAGPLSVPPVVRRIDAGLGAARYDARVEPHQHMACRRCGRIDDLDIEIDADTLLRRAAETGFRPNRAELVIGGLCADCARG